MTANVTTVERNTTDDGRLVVMPGKVGGAVLPFHPRTPPTPKLRAVALELGCSEASAEKRLYGEQAVNRQVAVIVEVLLRRGDTEDVAVFLAPIDAALAGDPTGLVVDAILTAAIADCHEDNAESRYHANPCRETAKALVEAGAIERARSVERDAELVAKWGL